MIGAGWKLNISHFGNAPIKSNFGDMKLKDVLVVPEIKKNLRSVSQFTMDNSCFRIFWLGISYKGTRYGHSDGNRQ